MTQAKDKCCEEKNGVRSQRMTELVNVLIIRVRGPFSKIIFRSLEFKHYTKVEFDLRANTPLIIFKIC